MRSLLQETNATGVGYISMPKSEGMRAHDLVQLRTNLRCAYQNASIQHYKISRQIVPVAHGTEKSILAFAISVVHQDISA